MNGAWGRRAAVAATVVALAAVLAAFRMKPIEVGQVSVTGTTLMARAEVARLTGVAPGRRLTWGDACRIEAAMQRLPAFSRARVTRGFTGTLHVRVTERQPAAWIPRAGRAAAADGTLLTHLDRRAAGLVAVDGFSVVRGMISDREGFAEALEVAKLAAGVGVEDAGLVRRAAGGGWEWAAAGKRIRLSSPPVQAEFGRLQRFREAFPAAWGAAGRLDVRFRERVVVR